MRHKSIKRFRHDLGLNISKLRKEQGLTQEELAKKAGIHRVTLARIEAGTFTPAATILANLADVLGNSMDSLISS